MIPLKQRILREVRDPVHKEFMDQITYHPRSKISVRIWWLVEQQIGEGVLKNLADEFQDLGYSNEASSR